MFWNLEFMESVAVVYFSGFIYPISPLCMRVVPKHLMASLGLLGSFSVPILLPEVPGGTKAALNCY
jgi:hypothetical protein